jgi:D-alanyl-D-alanine carboxypeptidase
MTFQLCRHLLWRRLGIAALAATIGLNPLLAAQDTDRHAALVLDANTGRVLYQRSADALRFPASLVKLMTLYLMFEQIEQGRLTLASTIRFSANAVAAAPSKLDVEEGTEIAVIDAIKALITKSANDVALAVAEHIGGSEAQFAQLMNRKAHELGMTATVFRNASGLPDPEQVTTARDMITLALRLHDQFPKYYPLFATRTFTWRGETFRNHNTLLFRYAGLDGMKTGYTRASGFNLVASARRGKKHVVAAYFGGSTAALRNAAVRAHLDAGISKASERKTRLPGPLPLAQARTQAMPEAGVAEAMPPPVIVAAVPQPQPALRPSPVAAGVEVARVRPVRVAPAPEAPAADAVAPAPAAEAADQPPTSIEEIIERISAPPESRPTEPAAAQPPVALPASKQAGVPAGAFQIQIGAYQTQGEAERQLATVRQRASSVLGAHAAHMSQVKRGDKVYFRARYVGFSGQDAAAGVCNELKRLDIDCLVMKAE